MSLKDYIDKYSGHNRFLRLLSIIENSGPNLGAGNEKNVTEAITLGYELAAKSNVLGMYKRIQQAATNYFKATAKKNPPANLAQSPAVNENALKEAYAQAVKGKDAEISR